MKECFELADFLTSPMAMRRTDAEALATAADRWQAGVKPLAAAKKAAPARRSGVALLPVYGPITSRHGFLNEALNWPSCEQISASLKAAVADPGIGSIVIDIDSPGGGVYGIEELARQIHEASKQKKVIAVANSLAASAAYWLASQASELVITPNGEVGSIGVYMAHRDFSQALRNLGENITLISAGERKTAGHPYGPLDEVSKAELQAGVNDYYQKFVRAVSRGRSVSQSAVKEGFGRGGMVRAEAAVRFGMADRIATLEEVISGLIGDGATTGTSASLARAAASSDPEIRRRAERLAAANRAAAASVAATNTPVLPPAKLVRPSDRTPEKDRALAFHEAGHAIALVALKLPFEFATLQPHQHADGGASLGHVQPTVDLMGTRGGALMAACGPAAERLFCGSGFLAGADLEFVMRGANSHGAREQIRTEADRFVATNNRAIRAVAEALIEFRVLTAAQIRSVAGPVERA